MDPVSLSLSLVGLIASIQQIIAVTYKYGKGVNDAKEEIKCLCSELFALKAALECSQMIVDTSANTDGDSDDDEKAESRLALGSTLIATREFRGMLEATEQLLAELSNRFQKLQRPKRSLGTSLIWPFIKEDIQKDVQRLERLKSYFVLTITTDNRETCRQLYQQFSYLTQALNNQQQQHDQEAREKFRKSVRQWLAPYDPAPSYGVASAADLPGTGQWFLRGAYLQWLGGLTPEKVLLLKGKPGIGKTTLMSAAIREFQAHHPDKGVLAFYFCSFTDLSSQDPVNMLGSLLEQVCAQEPSFWSQIDVCYQKAEKGRERARLTLIEAEALFSKACEDLPALYVFVDAINESEQAAVILSTILNLVEKNSKLHVVMSSTEELFALPSQVVSSNTIIVGMTSGKVAYDISDYVESWLETHERLRRLPLRLKDKIRSKLLSSSEGMFRWVHCQLQSLSMQKTRLGIEAALESVPDTLEQTYRNILRRISRDDRDLVKQTLLWLAYSVRPLAFDELCEAVAIDERFAGVDENARLLQPEDLLSTCSSLVHIDSKKDMIALAHSSVLLYLISDQIRTSDVHDFYIDPSTAHTTLTRKCVSYLCDKKLESGYCTGPEELEERGEDLPLLDYVVENWRHHARSLEEEQLRNDHFTRDLLFRFFNTASLPRGGNFGSWVQLYVPEAKFQFENLSPTFCAASFGLLGILKLIFSVQGTRDLECRGGIHRSTPLHVASYYGHPEVVDFLIGVGADVNEHNDNGKSGLECASFLGMDAIVRSLLKAGADPNFRNLEGQTPLFFAVLEGQQMCIKYLLEAGANTENIDGNGRSVGDISEMRLHRRIVKMRICDEKG